ncbi:hypothetical protein AB0M28_01820 [Streptomyces sp. NPDC051940]|uniref:hypothetical protein n=1 Tax=Streptomyces sp. NPDC051940 TaxID=3155675 RepID=UPI003427A119
MRKTPVLALALLGVALSATPAHAGDTVCEQDGVARLCATAQEVQDVTSIQYTVTQLDGPGSYQISYVDLSDGFTMTPQDVSPLRYQEQGTGFLYGALQHCFRVVLTSPAGTSLDVEPVCPSPAGDPSTIGEN